MLSVYGLIINHYVFLLLQLNCADGRQALASSQKLVKTLLTVPGHKNNYTSYYIFNLSVWVIEFF